MWLLGRVVKIDCWRNSTPRDEGGERLALGGQVGAPIAIDKPPGKLRGTGDDSSLLDEMLKSRLRRFGVLDYSFCRMQGRGWMNGLVRFKGLLRKKRTNVNKMVDKTGKTGKTGSRHRCCAANP